MSDDGGRAAPKGLTTQEAQARLRAEGPNELPRSERRTALRIVGEVVREPMLALLLGGGLIYLLIGDLKEALILMAFATLSVVITVVQETRTERVLEALRDLTSPRALVIRDGRRQRIAGRDVVRGDVVALGEGDRTPADAVLLHAHDLQSDESLLTGESAPVRKRADPERTAAAQRPGGEDQPFVYSGSLIVRGSALAEVTATGPRSEIGRIGQSLSALETEPPRLQAQTRRIVRSFALLGAAICALAVVLNGLLRGDWLQALLAGIALGMAMMPEEFPVVLTVFMAMGAWRISKARVLTRRASAIETLGSATVLCTDKTGTLTENRMSLAELRLPDGAVANLREAGHAPPQSFHDLIRTGVLASASDPVDPMERAFHAFANDHLDGHGAPARQLVRSYGLRPELLAMSQAWREGASGDALVAAKGSPEAIAQLCRMDEPAREALTASIDAMAAEGLRVLGVARATFEGDQWPEAQQAFDFQFVGLVGLADPLRASVPAAIAECRTAGVRVVMITGDYPETAKAIARQAGIDAGEPVSGDALAAMSDEDLAARVGSTNVFARILPEQKLRIVTALKARGEIVAMTGDGVNDAPSLKAAHIGVAMGGRGTDVAREASSMVLLDDDFGSIVAAIRLGRRIYDNLRKAMGYILAVHVPIAGLALIPLLFGLPTLLTPVHIASLELVIDPVCSLVFEAEREEKDVMRRRPRDPNEPLFSRALIAWGLAQGLFALALVAAIYAVALQRGMPVDEVRALAFFSLVMSILALVFVNRSFSASLATAIGRPNLALGIVLVTVASLLALTLAWPVARDLFRFGPLHADDLLFTLAAGLALLVTLETIKYLAAKLLRGAFSSAPRGPPA
ncbi:MAG: family hydrolase [Hyphomicrobiales bacterium]|nr:family hydrolase [Hyphomicrobiales bacterium]